LSPAIHALRTAALARGFDALPAIADAQIARDAALRPAEGDLNQWGGRLMQDGELPNAIAVFALATQLYPDSANTWDSLGEANEAAGNRDAAIAAYRKSLALDPGNANAERHLAVLQTQ